MPQRERQAYLVSSEYFFLPDLSTERCELVWVKQSISYNFAQIIPKSCCLDVFVHSLLPQPLHLLGAELDLRLLPREGREMRHVGQGDAFNYVVLLSETGSDLPCEAIKSWLQGEALQFLHLQMWKAELIYAKRGHCQQLKNLSFQSLLS